MVVTDRGRASPASFLWVPTVSSTSSSPMASSRRHANSPVASRDRSMSQAPFRISSQNSDGDRPLLNLSPRPTVHPEVASIVAGQLWEAADRGRTSDSCTWKLAPPLAQVHRLQGLSSRPAADTVQERDDIYDQLDRSRSAPPSLVGRNRPKLIRFVTLSTWPPPTGSAPRAHHGRRRPLAFVPRGCREPGYGQDRLTSSPIV